jgi:hypothetical protein
MDTKFLFPHRYRLVGCILAIPSAVIMILSMYWEFSFPFLHYSSGKSTQGIFSEYFLYQITDHNFTGEVASILVIVGLLMVAFSREREEDERTMKLRLESLLWAVYVNAALILAAIVFVYGTMFLAVLVYNTCATLLIFIVRYRWVLYTDRVHLKREVV